MIVGFRGVRPRQRPQTGSGSSPPLHPTTQLSSCHGEKEKMPIHRLMSVINNLEKVAHIVLLGDDIERLDHEKIMTWDEFINKGSSIGDSVGLDLMSTINADDTSSLIYTSGTTGNPKGVELTNKNFKVEKKLHFKILSHCSTCTRRKITRKHTNIIKDCH